MSELGRSSDAQGQAAPAGPPLSRQDTVPNLREDLVVARGDAPGQFEVKDPRGGGTLVLYDVELSVARMLDGRRRVSELLENAERLGIPVDVDGLSRFVRTLERQRFLGPRGSAAGTAGRSRPARKVWDARTRERFQAGMKLVRTGRPDQAVPVFQQLLAADPANAEAQEMLALIAAGHAMAASSVADLFAARRPGRAASRASWGWALLALAGLAGGGAVSWQLLERSGAARDAALKAAEAASREAQEAAREATAAARTAARSATAPAPVAAPEAITSAARTAPVERRWHPALGELRAPAAGVLAWREPFPTRVGKGERLGEVFAAAEPSAPGPEARARLEELERLAATDPVYQEFLEKERATLTGKAAAGRIFGLAAPLGGTLTLVARNDARVAQGEVVARLVDPEAWRLSVTLRGEPPPPGAACELAGDGASDRATGKVLGATARDGQHEVTCAVTAAQAPWLEQARAPYLRLP